MQVQSIKSITVIESAKEIMKPTNKYTTSSKYPLFLLYKNLSHNCQSFVLACLLFLSLKESLKTLNNVNQNNNMSKEMEVLRKNI